ncbi:alpha/beta hydrolase [Edaphosphingomonas haloaromaticamans]|uniref:Carboxylesterase NlhH n=1 Tax=Edaphosphingomonas haloaromaticamans TaxID=653954 RepID=A0A1S1HCR2_9SPHN|nr:Carboxylesterase NlhH [Sphingomonas haloaromaticamans]
MTGPSVPPARRPAKADRVPERPPVRPDVRAMLDYIATAPIPRLHEMTPADARELMKTGRDLIDLPVGELAVKRDFAIPGPHGADIPARLYDARATRAPGPLMIFFHGGGFVLGSLDSHDPLCAEIARALDMPVIAVDYRLAPEHPWPAAPDDAEAAARWIAANPPETGRIATGLVLAGDSAGGTLTIVTTLALRDAPAAVPVLAQWPIYPAADPGGRYYSYRDFSDGYYLDSALLTWFHESYGADLAHWRASPIKADHAGTPPTLVVTAGLDPLRDSGRAYAAALVQAGVPTVYREARGNIHGFMNMRRAIPSSQDDLAGCLAALAAIVAEAEAGRAMLEKAA